LPYFLSLTFSLPISRLAAATAADAAGFSLAFDIAAADSATELRFSSAAITPLPRLFAAFPLSITLF